MKIQITEQSETYLQFWNMSILSYSHCRVFVQPATWNNRDHTHVDFRPLLNSYINRVLIISKSDLHFDLVNIVVWYLTSNVKGIVPQ